MKRRASELLSPSAGRQSMQVEGLQVKSKRRAERKQSISKADEQQSRAKAEQAEQAVNMQ